MNGPGENMHPEFASAQQPGDQGAERLAEGFAEHVERWARRLHAEGPARELPGAAAAPRPPGDEDFAILRHAARQTSLATSDGHVCIMLPELAGIPPSSPGGGVGRAQAPGALRASLLATGVVGTPEFPGACPLILDEGGRLCLHRYFDYEVRLARRIMQAATAPPRTVTRAARELLDTLFPAAPGLEVDWQKIAAAMALRGSLAIVSGGPGTGKTTTVVNLLACLLTQEPDTRVALAAPTGKAAARMTEAIRQRAGHLAEGLREKLPGESFTIHRLLGVNPSRGEFTHHAGNPLPCDVLIVDEASMLDLALATRLLEAVPASARIILLGDKDQLAAVEAGAVFAELSADPTMTVECGREVAELCGYAPGRIAPPAPARSSCLQDAVVWLTRNYRFPADSGIGRLARSVNEGRAQEVMALLRESRAAQFAAAGDSSLVGEPRARTARGSRQRGADTASLSLFPEFETPGAGHAPAAAPASSLDTSVRWLDPEQGDDVLQAILAGYGEYFETVRRDPADLDSITRAFARFRVLCAVREGAGGGNWVNEQVTRHARRLLSPPTPEQPQRLGSPWYAGRPVMVLRNDYLLKLFNGDIGVALPLAGELVVVFPDEAAGFRTVPVARMPPHETAFATTVHKAQGSEFDAVLLSLPAQAGRVANRELLYTAVTRARRSASVFAKQEVLQAAIESPSQRRSGLAARMGGLHRPA